MRERERERERERKIFNNVKSITKSLLESITSDYKNSQTLVYTLQRKENKNVM